MKDIIKLRKKYEKYFAKKYCGISDVYDCKKDGICTCRMAAEIKAYIDTIIPKDVRGLDINDFDGRSNSNKQVLNPKIVINAKKKLIEYCWRNVNIKDLPYLDSGELSKKSIINERYQEGHNVVIYSGFSDNTSGKSLCASIILKEAIKLRLKGAPFNSHVYDWCDYSILYNNIKNNIEENDLADLALADWLVIDDISYTDATWKREITDPFFLTRCKYGLPTILVFRYNIDNMAHMSSLGVAFSKIIKNPDTVVIPLTLTDYD